MNKGNELEPVLVEESFRIVDGAHRLVAHIALGKKTINVITVEKVLLRK